MKNKISDLNNHLFAQLERLGEEDLTTEQLDKEIARSKAITSIATTIVESSRVTIEAMRLMEKAGADITRVGNNILQLEERKLNP